MRYAKAQKTATRARIVETAARAFQRDGIDGTGLAGLMGEAGLTKGGFYRHFASKKALLTEVLASRMAASAGRMRDFTSQAKAGAPTGIDAIIDKYLSAQHVTNREAGCILGSLSADLARGDDHLREAAMRGASGLVSAIEEALAEADNYINEAIAQAILGTLVGCLQLARLENNQTRRDAILAAGRRAAKLLARQRNEL